MSCPVRNNDKSGGGTVSSTSPWWPLALNAKAKPESRATIPENDQTAAVLPASVEEAAQYSQSPQPDQRLPLSTIRMVSSIPRADELRPAPAPAVDSSSASASASSQPRHAPHQPPNASHWVYPSEQQFYNAMRKKGYALEHEHANDDDSADKNNAPLSVIPFIVRIHNAVNERCWMEISRWERELHNNQHPRLIRFIGRPNDMSPKAWIQSNILFKKQPFDRHDWFIDRGDGMGERRYVIDFYNGHEETATRQPQLQPQPQSLPQSGYDHVVRPSMFVDVRPALDTPEALYDRVRMFLRDAFPAISRLSHNNTTKTTNKPLDK